MPNSPRVSVILPTYNRAKYLQLAIQSVLDQTYADLELIVVNDGSTDNTADLLDSFDDPRLRVINQPNHGRSYARNQALRLARGEYIAFQDSDDVYLPFKIEKQIAWLDEQTDFAAVYTSSSCIDHEGRPLNFGYRAVISGDIYPSIAFFQPVTITLPTVMLRRSILEVVGNFDESMNRFEDTDLWRRIAKRFKFGAMDEVTCMVRTHPDNALVNQDCSALTAAVDFYVSKILAEDGDIRPDVLGAGARRLYEHYGYALTTVPEFLEAGLSFKAKAKEYFQPKVSIVIPVYNGSDYLREAIDSALAQTYPNVEVLVINDGSNDEGATEQIALSYGDRIRYFAKSNGGVASALNYGVEQMSGELFSWLSHDDLYLADKIDRQVSDLVHQPEPLNCIVYGDYAVFSESAEAASPVKLPQTPPEQFRYFITTQNILHGCTLLVPKSAFQKNGLFNESLKTTQDYDLWYRLASTHRFIHSSHIGVLARSHAAQGTHRMKDTVLAECNTLLANFAKGLSETELHRATSKPVAESLIDISRNLAQRGYVVASMEALRLAGDAAQKSFPILVDDSRDLNFQIASANENIENSARSINYTFSRLNATVAPDAKVDHSPIAASRVVGFRTIGLIRSSVRWIFRPLPYSVKVKLKHLWERATSKHRSISC